MGGIHFRALGPLEVDRDGQPVALGGPKQRAVLAILLLDPGRVVSTDRIADSIWGNTGEDMSSAVQVYVAKLRKELDPERTALPAGVIETVRPGYRVTLTPDSLDVLDFDELTRLGRRHLQAGRPGPALEAFQSALDLCRGSMVEDLSEFAFVAEAATHFERTRQAARVDVLDCLVALNRHAETIDRAEHLIALEPYDERLTAILMRSLYLAGRQADALAVYRRLEGTLRDDMGLQPGPELQRLELMILEQAPELVPAPAIATAHTTIRHGFETDTVAFLTRGGEAMALTRAVTTIGRLADRIVVIDDPGVSRRHAEIRRTADGFRLVDTGSTNGTYVNGARVADHLLEDEDVITLGANEVIFRIGGSSPGGEPPRQ